MMDVGLDGAATVDWSQQLYESLFASRGAQHVERLAWLVEDEPSAPSQKTPAILAFLVARRVLEEWELENIVVKIAARRCGMGTCLLNELVAHARSQRGSAILLEVRESNYAARALYRKMSFEETGLRKSYYIEPAEDAILYRLELD